MKGANIQGASYFPKGRKRGIRGPRVGRFAMTVGHGEEGERTVYPLQVLEPTAKGKGKNRPIFRVQRLEVTCARRKRKCLNLRGGDRMVGLGGKAKSRYYLRGRDQKGKD